MDLVREFAEKHGWTPNHILCSYDFVRALMSREARKLHANPLSVVSYIKGNVAL